MLYIVLEDEPDAGESSVGKIAFKLPSTAGGHKVSRRFRVTDTVMVSGGIYTYVLNHKYVSRICLRFCAAWMVH